MALHREHFVCVCVSICIWMACERYLSVSFGVIKLIGIGSDVISIFYFFMVFLLVLGFIGYLWELIGLLSDYHNSCYA